jgi:hypothetical protein
VLRRWTLGILTILLGFLAAVALAEVGIRLANRHFPYFYCYDAQRGWGLRPGVTGYYNREGHAEVSINSAGFRGPEVSAAKPHGVFRVAVLGDSYAEAIQVPYDETFSAVAARELTHCQAVAGRRVQVLDFGVDGYGTAQELITLRRKVWAYSPDMVVLALFMGNDIRNNSVTLEGDQCRPFFVFRDGRLVEGGPFINSPAFRAWCMVRFDYRSANLLATARAALTTLMEHPRGPTAQYPVERAINYEIYRAPTTAAWRDAWRVTEALVATMNHEVRAHGTSMLVVTLGTGIQEWPNPKVRARFLKLLHVHDLLYPDRRILALGEKDGFAVLPLAEPLGDYAEKHQVYLHGFNNTPKGFGHWNALGHRLAGELIAQKLCMMIGGGACSACAPAFK